MSFNRNKRKESSPRNRRLTGERIKYSEINAPAPLDISEPAPNYRHMVSVNFLAHTNQVLSGLPIIDGIQTASGDLVLCSYQTVQSENGIYKIIFLAWEKQDGNFDITPEIHILDGFQYFNSKWLQDKNPVDDASLTFREIISTSPQIVANVKVTSAQLLALNGAGSYLTLRTIRGDLNPVFGANCGIKLLFNSIPYNTDADLTIWHNTPSGRIPIYNTGGGSPAFPFNAISDKHFRVTGLFLSGINWDIGVSTIELEVKSIITNGNSDIHISIPYFLH